MNERRFTGDIDKLRNAERVERLQMNRVLPYCLAGIAAKSAVDIGTGTGLFAEAFYKEGLKVCGVDCNSEFLNVARQLLPEIEFFEAPAERLPLADQSADLVFMGHVLHETDDAAAAMREAFRVTRRRLAVLEWPYVDQPVGPPIDHRIKVENIRQLGEAAGFSVCDVIQLRLMQLVIFDR
ncbi:MAG: class I SAM-dependent methyltransferase [Candidatus Riflebacteria bacterium]|jgi:ubiquinone/menaquinone biosynthesis C-methylase UbiE|nr:class I SAM-dependent methyltransferase [Candidatus Riflebacteria bacterium]